MSCLMPYKGNSFVRSTVIKNLVLRMYEFTWWKVPINKWKKIVAQTGKNSISNNDSPKSGISATGVSIMPKIPL